MTCSIIWFERLFYQRTVPGINMVVEPLEIENEVNGTSGKILGVVSNQKGQKPIIKRKATV